MTSEGELDDEKIGILLAELMQAREGVREGRLTY